MPFNPLHFALLSVLAGIISPASAQSPGGHVQAGVTGGTLGIGPEIGYRASDHFGIRANATFLKLSAGFESNDLDYRGKARLKSGGVMVDAFPFGGGFRLSAGGRLNGNEGRVRAMPNRPVTVGNTTYTPAQIGTITGNADVRRFTPAVTLGWAGRNRQGFVFGAEVGALFQGRARLDRFVSSTGLIRPSDLERERQELQDDINEYKVYPIAQIMIGYRF